MPFHQTHDDDDEYSSECVAEDESVSIKITKNPKRVTINFKRAATAEEIQLCADIDRTTTTIAWIFGAPERRDEGFVRRMLKSLAPSAEDRDAEAYFDYYLKRLFRIARMGLKDSPSTQTASAMLKNFQIELMLSEGARAKNSYMQMLGCKAFLFAVVAFLLHVACLYTVPLPDHSMMLAVDSLLLMWAGAMIGCWLSFGIRNVDFTFASLGQPEADLLRPNVRLVFTGILTAVLGLIFILGVVNLNIGDLNTQHLWKPAAAGAPAPDGDKTSLRVLTALLVGLFCGISEKVLSATIGTRATQFIGQISK